MAATPSAGSTTTPKPERKRLRSLSANTRRASSRRRNRSVRQSFANSTAARARFLLKSLSFPSKRSNSVKASAVAPAKPARIEPSPSRRSFLAPCFITVLSSVTWPSAPRATLPSLRTQITVVERIFIGPPMLTLRCNTCDATLAANVRLRRDHPLRRNQQRTARVGRVRPTHRRGARRGGSLVPRSHRSSASGDSRRARRLRARVRARFQAGRGGRLPLGGGGVREPAFAGIRPRAARGGRRGRHHPAHARSP